MKAETGKNQTGICHGGTEHPVRRSRNQGRLGESEAGWREREWEAAVAVIEARVMKPKTILPHGRGVADFLAQHGDKVTGVVSGYDRLRLQGTLRALYVPEIFENYLWRAGVWFKNYTEHVKEVSEALCDSAKEIARSAGTALRHLRSAATRKEELIAQRLLEQPQDEGLVAVLSVVEPCRTWKMRGNYQTKRLEPRLEFSTCRHLYFYFIDEQFGLMHLRLQTWFPFLVHICLNGREWLCRQLRREGIAYDRADNCLPWIEDVPRAQALLDAQGKTRWQNYLPKLIERFHPNHQRLHDIVPIDYYWTVAESEYATDIMFRDRASPPGALSLACAPRDQKFWHQGRDAFPRPSTRW